MRAVVQRTRHSQVVIAGEKTAAIGTGLMVLLGIKKGDTMGEAEYMMDKILNLRIFEDAAGKMNRSLLEIKGEVLMVSQFTLYGDARKGRRPSFTAAEDPDSAWKLFAYCVDYVAAKGVPVQTGQFGADMQVLIENDGPCTILLDSERAF